MDLVSSELQTNSSVEQNDFEIVTFESDESQFSDIIETIIELTPGQKNKVKQNEVEKQRKERTLKKETDIVTMSQNLKEGMIKAAEITAQSTNNSGFSEDLLKENISQTKALREENKEQSKSLLELLQKILDK